MQNVKLGMGWDRPTDCGVMYQTGGTITDAGGAGWEFFVAYYALIVASIGVRARKKLIGLLLGVPLIYLGNLLRLILIVAGRGSSGVDDHNLFPFVIAQALPFVFVLGLWFLWSKSEKRNIGSLIWGRE